MAKSKSKQQRLRAGAPHLCKVPKHLPTIGELMDEFPQMTVPGLAKVLGVAERTVRRWRDTGGSRVARLAVWWVTWEGHAHWDHEMHMRTVLALQLNESLWATNERLQARVDELEALLFAEPELVALADDLVDQVEFRDELRKSA